MEGKIYHAIRNVQSPHRRNFGWIQGINFLYNANDQTILKKIINFGVILLIFTHT